MFKAAKAWSFLESWLDGLLICKYKLLFLGGPLGFAVLRYWPIFHAVFR